MKDIYQTRYLEHQKKKKMELLQLMKMRHSDRIFSDDHISESDMKLLLSCIDVVPSSCNRHGVTVVIIDDRNKKELLAGLLVGGVGWLHRADKILMLLGNKCAYKEGLDFMPYIDAGIVIQQLYLTCAGLELKCCYVNPNIRKENQRFFHKQFAIGDNYFCGVMAIGMPLKEKKV